MLVFYGAYGSVPTCSECSAVQMHRHQIEGDEHSPATLTLEASSWGRCYSCGKPYKEEQKQEETVN